MSDDTPLCRGCGTAVEPGYNWHRDCLASYRGSAHYRRDTLARDGYACARCPAWWNHLVLSWYGGELAPDGSLSAGARSTGWRARVPLLRRERWVQVDHHVPLAGAGTHDPTNMQVLCQGLPLRHHPRKTRRDLAALRGQRPRVSRPRLAAAAALVLALLVARAGLGWRAAAAAAVLLALLAARHRAHRAVAERLHASYAEVTGAAVTHRRRALRASRWRWRRVPGLALPRLRPTRQEVRYPHTFPDHDPDQQRQLEARVAAKTGGTWTAEWHTGADRVVLSSPDPLEALGGVPWPNAGAPRLSAWEPVPLGVGEGGRVETATLVGKNVLIGGEPEAGKSVSQSLITATLCLDPSCEVYGVDGKEGMELGFWDGSMETIAVSRAEALAVVEHLRDVVDLRAAMLRRERLRKITPDMGMTPVGFVVDELALFTSPGTSQTSRKSAADFTEALRDVVSRGRALGVVSVLATQRPSAKVLDTDVRDLIGYRWALRCNTASASNMILGEGWASLGYSAAKVPATQRGGGLLYAEGSTPRRLRSFLVDDATLSALAGRAAALRAGLGALPRDAGPARTAAG